MGSKRKHVRQTYMGKIKINAKKVKIKINYTVGA
jgi:hypothetical protein